MSTLGGIYNFNGTPVDQRLLVAMGAQLASNGPDGESYVRSEQIGMVYRAFYTNEESRRERQPLVSPSGTILCWDGRLDNRSDLFPALRDGLRGDHTDAAMVVAAYEKWGEDFLSRIVGDFALSLWNPRTRLLLLARDLGGPRPLFYHSDDNRFVWSSELPALLDLPGITVEVSEDYVAGYLISRNEPNLTPYENIYAVPPGSAVIALNGHVQTRRFWGPYPNHEISYRTDAEYEEHFEHLFREAVRCRLRADGPVWATLSGGLDSSAIVCMADEILKGGEASASRLETVSYIYDESSDSDEREFINAVEVKRGRRGNHFLESEHPLLSLFPDEAHLSFPDGMDFFLGRHLAVCAAMRRDGARVLLAGFGGDEMLYSSPDPSPDFGDCLVQGRLVALHRSLRIWSKALKRPYVKLLWRSAMLPLLPMRLQAAHLEAEIKIPGWYDEDFLRRTNFRERYVGLGDAASVKMPSRRNQVGAFLSAVHTISRASYRSRGPVELATPYLHRPLVEFLLAVPFTQKLRPGETRSLMRRSLRNLLPEKILNRKGKKGAEEPFLRAIAREWFRLQPMFENPQVCSRGYMNTEALLSALERARHGCGKGSAGLTRTITLEFWLRALQTRCSLSRNTAMKGDSIAQFAAVSCEGGASPPQ